ncbi:MAG: NAD(P)H-hydrate dehydratase [Prevotellaceae bacterium]|jgi:NAD(P)H-hydrate epimerase|nr:NAD(P)H-hydrate dehydratase [Prevotellaceae bacterium]
MKFFTTDLIPSIDEYTLANEPVSSIDLMERAARSLSEEIQTEFTSIRRLFIFCGTGNNGGDGLALARLMFEKGYEIQVFLAGDEEKLSHDAAINLRRLRELIPVEILRLQLPEIPADALVVDALFGSGLNRRIVGRLAELVEHINSSKARIVSIDMPSGLKGEDFLEDSPLNIIRAELTLTLQMPKLSLLMADAGEFSGNLRIVPIGLHPQALLDFPSEWFYVEEKDVRQRLKPRKRFAHKGDFGKVFLAAGSYGMAGAAALCAKAAYRVGAGLVRVHLPSACVDALQTTLPEAVLSIDVNREFITALDPSNHTAAAAGPGLGRRPETAAALKQLLETKIPMALDADALNAIAADKELLRMIPPETVLTPHRKEFERLLQSEIKSDYRLFMEQLRFAKEHQVVLVLKGAATSIALPDGRAFFNSTGNAGMATAGSGDVLTGVIAGLLAQGYSAEDAAIVGVYMHGLAGDMAALQKSQASVMASDIVDALAFLGLRQTFGLFDG